MGWSLLFERQNRDVASKLGRATLAMFTLPIITFYVCYWYVFPNKADPNAWAGGTAVIVANLVIALYVVSAFSEEDEDYNKDNDDASGPRTGVFKKRTD